jgi:hypothetical protein
MHINSERLVRSTIKARSNEKSRYLIFVLDGTLRPFTVDHDGNEHVMQFAFDAHWV